MSGVRGDGVVNLAVNRRAIKVIQDFAAGQRLDAMTLHRIAVVAHDPSTISIKREVAATSEVDSMERYSDKVLKEIKSKPGPGVPEQGEN